MIERWHEPMQQWSRERGLEFAPRRPPARLDARPRQGRRRRHAPRGPRDHPDRHVADVDGRLQEVPRARPPPPVPRRPAGRARGRRRPPAAPRARLGDSTARAGTRSPTTVVVARLPEGARVAQDLTRPPGPGPAEVKALFKLRRGGDRPAMPVAGPPTLQRATARLDRRPAEDPALLAELLDAELDAALAVAPPEHRRRVPLRRPLRLRARRGHRRRPRSTRCAASPRPSPRACAAPPRCCPRSTPPPSCPRRPDAALAVDRRGRRPRQLARAAGERAGGDRRLRRRPWRRRQPGSGRFAGRVGFGAAFVIAWVALGDHARPRLRVRPRARVRRRLHLLRPVLPLPPVQGRAGPRPRGEGRPCRRARARRGGSRPSRAATRAPRGMAARGPRRVPPPLRLARARHAAQGACAAQGCRLVLWADSRDVDPPHATT